MGTFGVQLRHLWWDLKYRSPSQFRRPDGIMKAMYAGARRLRGESSGAERRLWENGHAQCAAVKGGLFMSEDEIEVRVVPDDLAAKAFDGDTVVGECEYIIRAGYT